MYIFLHEYLWTVAFVILFGLIGIFTLVPFRDTIKYPLLASPLAGGFILTIGTILLYDVAHFPLFISALVVSGSGILFSIISFYFIPQRISKEEIELLTFAAIVCGFVTYIANYATIHFGCPGFSYMQGTDHLGYAQVSEWLQNHLVSQLPILSPNAPEYSWTHFVYNDDNPRFGSYFYLAIITAFRSGSSLFNYDFACGIVLMTAYMGVSAVIAKKRSTFILLLLGLLFGIWFNYSRSGYFAKILTYPALIYTIGLFLNAKKPLSSIQTAVLSLFFCAIGTFFPGVNVGLLFIAFSLIYLLIRVIYHRLEINSSSDSMLQIGQDLIVIALFGGIMIIASGVLSWPSSYAVAPMDTLMPILSIFSYLVEINNMVPTNLKFTEGIYLLLFTAVIVIFCTISIRIREKIASTFFLFPLVLIVGLLSLLIIKEDLIIQWISYELVGLYYPFMVCGIIVLLDKWALMQNKHQMQFMFGMLACVLVLWAQLHKFSKDVEHFAGKKIKADLQFSKNQLDTLIKAISNKPVYINGAGMDTNRALPLLVYLKPQVCTLEWSPTAWEKIVGYRHWKVAVKNPNPTLIIELINQPLKKNCSVKFKTQQYRLVKCIKAKKEEIINHG
jgi:hypothetical protein